MAGFENVSALRDELAASRAELAEFTAEQIAAKDPAYLETLARIERTRADIRSWRPGVDPESPEGVRQWEAEKLDHEIEELQAKRRQEEMWARNDHPRDSNPIEHEEALRQIDDAIVERQIRARSFRQPDDAVNPDVVRDDVEFLGGLGADTVSAPAQMDFERRRAAELERRKQEEEAATAAAAAAASERAQMGDFERAVRDTEAVPDPLAIDNAQASDDMVERHGCTPRVLAGVGITAIIAIIAVLVGLNVGDDDGAKCPKAAGGAGEALLAAEDCGEVAESPNSNEATDTPSTGSSKVATPPNPDDLASGVLLFQGTSGGPIGCIACDGQSRFLSLERSGVGVGNASSADFETVWNMEGKVLTFGARLTAPNKGRYGVNLWIDGGTYGPGVALEIGEQSAQYQWSPERDGTIHAGHRMSIIIGEQGIVDDDGVPLAKGEYQLEWWFTFQPD